LSLGAGGARTPDQAPSGSVGAPDRGLVCRQPVPKRFARSWRPRSDRVRDGGGRSVTGDRSDTWTLRAKRANLNDRRFPTIGVPPCAFRSPGSPAVMLRPIGARLLHRTIDPLLRCAYRCGGFGWDSGWTAAPNGDRAGAGRRRGRRPGGRCRDRHPDGRCSGAVWRGGLGGVPGGEPGEVVG
jgi:hypothetical protein